MTKKVKEIDIKTENIKRMISFNKRWEVANNFNYNTFKTRCLEIIKNEIDNECLKIGDLWRNAADALDVLCNKVSFILGIENDSDGFSKFEFKQIYRFLYKLDLNCKDDYIIFLYFLETIINIEDDLIDNQKMAFNIAEAFRLSNANLKIIKNGSEYHIIPINNDFFDEPLIIDNLKWLDKYEEVKIHFLKSLKFERKEELYRNIIDELRLSLELFFKKILNNDKSLEKQLPEIGEYLKENNVSSNISNMYYNLLDLYTKYNNKNAKHGDKIVNVEVDFLTYLTGAFMRLMLQIEEEKKTI